MYRKDVKEVGIIIEPVPYGRVITPAQTGAMQAGVIDIQSAATGACIGLHKQLPNLRFFIVGDIFQGYAIISQPKGNYKSFEEFVQEGYDSDEVMRENSKRGGQE